MAVEIAVIFATPYERRMFIPDVCPDCGVSLVSNGEATIKTDEVQFSTASVCVAALSGGGLLWSDFEGGDGWTTAAECVQCGASVLLTEDEAEALEKAAVAE